MSEITTHVLDVALGRPAAGIPVTLEIASEGGGWKELSRGATDGDGRLLDLVAPGSLVEGTYRLTFETHVYFDLLKLGSFYPRVVVEFHVLNAKKRYHIPLLLSPYSYSIYRGS
jgi:5-hydroxyisourate hydrolase